MKEARGIGPDFPFWQVSCRVTPSELRRGFAVNLADLGKVRHPFRSRWLPGWLPHETPQAGLPIAAGAANQRKEFCSKKSPQTAGFPLNRLRIIRRFCPAQRRLVVSQQRLLGGTSHRRGQLEKFPHERLHRIARRRVRHSSGPR